MSERREHELPQDLAEIGELLRESRVRPTPLELDSIKLQAKARARRQAGSPWQLRRGASVRSRGVTAVLTLLLIGGTTAGGIAGGSGSSGGGSSSDAQYQPPKCTKDMRACACPKGYHLAVSGNAIVCEKDTPPPPPPPPGPGHGHHHHHWWKQGGHGQWQWCDNGRDWHDWNGRDDDW